jgi:hypothetical protein
VQATVWDLVFKDGTPTGKVLKMGHQDLSHKLFLSGMATSMMSLQKEWEIGMQLKAAMEDENGNLPGFTRTCDCMAVQTGDSEKKHSVVFRGLMMEKIQGYSVASRVTDPTFHNIHYIREMLFQVFSALDAAQRRTGFCHADLGLNNVMEHYPVISSSLMETQRSQNLDAMKENSEFKVSTPGKDDKTWSRPKASSGCEIPPPVPGYSCAADGSKLPLGPTVEFKIIDYGVGEFNTTLAQAAGGYTAEETLQAVHAAFEQRGIPVGASANEDLLRLVQEDGRQLEDKLNSKKMWRKKPKRGLFLKKNSEENRFVVVVERSESTSPRSSVKFGSKSRQTTSVQPGVIEKMYRSFWERKGDVFHLLLSLAVTLDDHVWPKADEKDVQLFISLVHHVTGVKMRAYFVSPDESSKTIKVMGRRLKQGDTDPDADGYKFYLYGARCRVFNKLRKFNMLMAAHFKPFNSGILAGEALVSPFFGNKGPPHAELPVCVEAAFPFK